MVGDDKDMQERAREAGDKAAHSATADKTKGHIKEGVGRVKEQVGGVVGDRELETKGEAQHAEGTKDRLKGEIKEKIEDVKERVKAGAEVAKEKIDEMRGKK